MADVANTLNGWSTTESSNLPLGTTTIGTGLDENLRMIQAVVRQTQDTGTIASATTTDLSTINSKYITVSGTTTITGLGTLTAGMTKWLIFSGALTLTHNGTSLILPGAANITTVAGDTALMESLGSGNWKCLAYEPTTWTGTGGQVHAASPTLSGTVGGALAWSGAQTFNAGAVIAASQALTGTVGSSTISGFLSVAATTGTFTNVGGTLSTVTQNSVTTMTGLVTVGALNAGSITSGFGSIDVGTDAISGGAGTFNTGANTTSLKVGGSAGTSAMLVLGANLETQITAMEIRSLEASTGGTYILFTNSATNQAGAITHNGTTTVAYGTSSDKRRKTDLGLATSTDVLRATEVHNFSWKEDGSVDLGVFAQDAILVNSRAINHDALTDTWTADYSKYVPDLIVGWQNHESRLRTIEKAFGEI